MKTMWINLPVKHLNASRTFFKAIGFRENPIHEKAEHMSSFLIGDTDFVMVLFPEETFKCIAANEISDTSKVTEVLLNIDAQSKAEVDEMAKIVRDAGGKIFGEPAESEGWMYAFGFEDLDGHRWGMLYMDMDKMPKS
ncbi:MAG TPA: extradiol dioxygenase [Pricia antarctica]|uniref:Extradiol dioxygenase n=2 Tax=root TaxID=1 RepID=A0A831VQE8_9FLAO|nr:extradiol dioxygenase [Pricia antarctica]